MAWHDMNFKWVGMYGMKVNRWMNEWMNEKSYEWKNGRMNEMQWHDMKMKLSDITWDCRKWNEIKSTLENKK